MRLPTERDSLERRDGFWIIDDDRRILHPISQERPQNIGAVSGRAAADVVGRLDQQHGTLRDGQYLLQYLVQHPLADEPALLQAECKIAKLLKSSLSGRLKSHRDD